MTISDEELAADAEAAPIGHNSLAELSSLVETHQEKSRQLSDLEDKVKTLKKEITEYEETKIPDAMMAIGVEKFTMTDGTKIDISPIVRGNIPAKNRAEASIWLRNNEGEDLIKNEVTISFTSGQDGKAHELTKKLESDGYAPVLKETVHPQTLCSWAREKLGKGAKLPLDLLGIYHGRRARIKLPK